jgi:hypothetical protein
MAGRVHTIPCHVSPVIASQLFPPRERLQICSRQCCVSALETYDNWTTNSTNRISNQCRFFTHEIIRRVNCFVTDPRRHAQFVPWFQAYAAMLMKSLVFWVITRRRVVIIYRRFGINYRSHLHGSRFQVGNSKLESWPVKMGPIRCPETSVIITTRRRVIIQKTTDFSSYLVSRTSVIFPPA